MRSITAGSSIAAMILNLPPHRSLRDSRGRIPQPLHRHADAPPHDGRRQSGRIRLRNATRGLNPDGYAAATERAPLTYFTVEQHYDKLIEVSGGYGERITEARHVLPALERAMKAVLVEKSARRC